MAYRDTVPPGRAHRPGRLPPPRPQRGRRAGLHPAGDVRARSGPLPPCGALRRPPGRGRGADRGGGRGEAEQAYQRLVDIQQAAQGEHRPPPTPRSARYRLSRGPGRGNGARAEFTPLAQRAAPHLAEGFTVHPKLAPAARAPARGAGRGRDRLGARGGAGARLAAREGVPLRLTGQDTERGTFSQRHLVLHDAKTGGAAPIQKLPDAGARSSCTTARSPSWPRWASSTATASRRPSCWCSGRRSSATS